LMLSKLGGCVVKAVFPPSFEQGIRTNLDIYDFNRKSPRLCI
jgi:hypothetical protein